MVQKAAIHLYQKQRWSEHWQQWARNILCPWTCAESSRDWAKVTVGNVTDCCKIPWEAEAEGSGLAVVVTLAAAAKPYVDSWVVELG